MTDATAFAALTDPDWTGRDLAGAQIRFCELRRAQLAGIQAKGSFWEHCSLRGADLTDADLTDAMLRDCVLEHAVLERATLVGARLVRCSLEGASLADADLADATMVGCSLKDAEFHAARNFGTARDMIVEVLLRAADGDPELVRWVGLVALKREWCYDEWATELAAHPRQRRIALEAFRQYPDSGFAALLRAGAISGRVPAVADEAATAVGAARSGSATCPHP